LTTKFTQHTQDRFQLSAISFQLKTFPNTPLNSMGLCPAPRTLALGFCAFRFLCGRAFAFPALGLGLAEDSHHVHQQNY
jgi:hypothetical protein